MTAQVRTAFGIAFEHLQGQVEGWIERVAEANPEKAADLTLKLAEFCIPKLGRVEHTGEDGGAIVFKAIVYPDPLKGDR